MRREGTFANKSQISIIGVGSEGCQIINQVIKQGRLDVNFACLDSDTSLLSQMKSPVIQISWPDAHTALKVSRITEAIIPFLDAINLLMVITSLGDTMGPNVARIVAEVAQTKDIFTLAMVILPASDEGASQQDIALRELVTLRTIVNAMIVLPLERFSVDGRSPSQALFEAQNHICGVIKAICTLLLPGLVNIDFSALQSVLKIDGPIFMRENCTFGPDRASLIVQNAMYSSQLNLSIDGADNVLLQMRTGPKFYLWEFTEIITGIKQQISADANLTFGIIIDPDMEDEICLTILATGFDQ